jgi:hypothetical protein
MSKIYDYIVKNLQPKLRGSFGFATNSFGIHNNFTSTYDNDLRFLHNDSVENLFQTHLRFTSEYTWEQFEQNKTSLYEKEFENLVVFKDNNSGRIFKLQRIETFFYKPDSTNSTNSTESSESSDYDDPNEPVVHFLDQEHFRELLFHKLVYEIMTLTSDTDILYVPQLYDTYTIKLKRAQTTSLYSVMEMEDVGIDFSDYLMELPSNQQRSIAFVQTGLKLLKTLVHLNKYIGFVHFDAKLNNILTRNNKFYLIDFGMSHVSYKDLTFSNELSINKNVTLLSDVVFYVYHSLGLSFCSERHIFTEDVILFCSDVVLQLPKEINENLCDKLNVGVYKLVYIKNRKTFTNYNFPSKFYDLLRKLT